MQKILLDLRNCLSRINETILAFTINQVKIKGKKTVKKIKICFIILCLGYGGAEKSLYYLVKLMDKNKFDITVFAVLAGGKMERDFIDLGVKVKTPYSCALSSNNIVGKTANHFIVKRVERMVNTNSSNLLKTATGEDYDIVVSYHVDSSCYAAGFPKKGKRIKYIHADLANSPSYVNDNKYLFDLKIPYNKVIGVSGIAQAGYHKVFGKNGSSAALLNPIDSKEISRLANENSVNLQKGSYVCALGRLTKEKGFARLIDVYTKLKESQFPYKLVIMGEGPEADNLKKKISDNKMEDLVILMGHQSNPYPVIKNSKFLIVPSYSEGLSMTAMEAISLGVPVVSTCPSVGDILGDEPCGIITDNSDDALYEGMIEMSDEKFYHQAKQAAERRSRFFDGRKMAEQVENMYLDILNDTKDSEEVC